VERGGPTTGTERALAEVLAQVLRVGQVPVDSHFFNDLGADSMLMAQFCARVRKREDLPSVSMKDVYQHPTVRSLGAMFAPPSSPPVETALAEVLASVLGVDRVSADSDFFDDLGADSMLMARFCARVRKREDLPSVSMKDVYQHRTVSGLAAALAPLDVATPAVVQDGESTPAPSPASISSSHSSSYSSGAHEATQPTSTRAYVLCGMVQLLIFLGYVYLFALVAVWGYEHVTAGSGVRDTYVRMVLFGSTLFFGTSIVPIAAKWILIGRWKPQQIRIWSPGYLRFWVVKTLLRANPLLRVVVGSPLYGLYLRALGAKVGKGVAIFSRSVPVCTDLLTIGDGAVIRKDSLINGYRGRAGMIETGTVTLGRDAFVGEMTVVDIGTSLGDGSQLGHSSSLHTGQAVPDGEHWHGSPAERTDADYRAVGPADCGRLRRAVYASVQLLSLVFVYLPLGMTGIGVLFAAFPDVAARLETEALALTDEAFYLHALEFSAIVFFGALLFGLLFACTVPRALNLFLTAGKTYPLYGFHYTVHRSIARFTNSKILTWLFGDSSFIVHYLQALGYDLSRVEQTGSNFGTVVKHESPYLSSIGRGTMVADGLSIMNADFSSTSFTVSRTSIGPHNFLGNGIAYPAQGRTGENCLLATKVLVPIDGKIREGVGLLGSPSFEIPRSVERDSTFDHLKSELPSRLAAKNRYNLRTMGVALLVRWGYVFGATLLGMAMGHYYRPHGAGAMAGWLVLMTLFTTGYFVLVERGITRFRGLRPQFCSIYDPYFWWHERYWKLIGAGSLYNLYAGTPFKNVISRMLGLRVGRRVFDDGCAASERTLATIGDDCTLNASSTIQCHSQEDGNFKSDRTAVGDRCTLGVGAFVHYGVSVGDDAVLAPDSFLMKGEEVPAGAHWGGNPAREMADEALSMPAGRHRRPKDGSGGAAELVGVGPDHDDANGRQVRDGNPT
jgi:non-ribosomal peptide synthetase-like protein